MLVAVLTMSVVLAACGGNEAADGDGSVEDISAAGEDSIVTESGLIYTVLTEGNGDMPETGDTVVVHYTGTLEDGTVFDSSFNRGQPFEFTLGVGQVIQGWDEGVAMMREGEEAVLTIPADIAYGDSGSGSIPPGATLIFRVSLLDINPGAEPEPEQEPDSSNEESTNVTDENTVTTDSGLQYTQSEAGNGEMPEAGDIVSVHYTGSLEDGTVFDSSYNRGEPFQFTLGRGQVIAGWDEGIALMSVGEKGTLVIPSELGYGSRGAGAVIPPDATLLFDVELVAINP